MKRYPFKFLDAYTKEDRNIFFGREQEIDDLYRMVFQTNLLLVYGASGTGKTSLIRCGLANRFNDTQWLDLYIRRGTDINRSLLETIRKYTPQFADHDAGEKELDWFEQLVKEEQDPNRSKISNMISDHPVSRALEELYLATFTPIYLIFDQFEELYTLGNPEEQQQFIRLMEELVQIPLPVKIIIVMREEYLAKLYDLEMAVPQLRNKKLRIEAMDLARVEQVILQATLYNRDSNVHLETGKEQEVARLIVEKIREGDVNIKLPYLQVFMDRLYEQASGEAVARDREVTIDEELVETTGNIGDVLANFIERQAQRVYKHLLKNHDQLPTDIAWRILSPFATIDGTKVPIRQLELSRLERTLPAELASDGPAIIREAIAELENSRILRYRKEEKTYEVAHDTLAVQIAAKRSEEEKAYLKTKRIVTEGLATYNDTETLLSKEQLAFIAPYRSRLQEELNASQWEYVLRSQQQRDREQRKLRRSLIGGFLVALLVIIFVLWQQRKTQRALNEVLAAQAAREKTELNVLLQNAAQIAKGSNCPPREMRQMIDSLYQKHQSEAGLQQQYQETMSKLTHCK
ncbi:MAG: ATP-binding protein [Saprospiraceae bacterium]|nr:AAA family ATPase [Lewinella sp.]